MSRIERWRAALAALGLVFASTAVAAPTEVSLLLGDLDSMTAVEAARILRQDRKLADVRFNVYPASEIRSRDLAPLKRSRLVLLQTVGRTLAHAVSPELDHVRKQGGRVYAVGVSWDDDLAKLGLIRDESMRA